VAQPYRAAFSSKNVGKGKIHSMYRQIMRFVVAGVVGFIVDAAVLYFGLALGLGYFGGRAVSFLCAVWATWQINRRYTFVAERQETAWSEWWRYLAAMSLGGVVNYTAYSATVVTFRDIRFLPIIAVAVGSLAGLAVNFATAKLWVFRRR
jgi:putative flippase GtrA